MDSVGVYALDTPLGGELVGTQKNPEVLEDDQYEHRIHVVLLAIEGCEKLWAIHILCSPCSVHCHHH